MLERRQKKIVNHKGTVISKYTEICSAYNNFKFNPCPREEYTRLCKHSTMPLRCKFANLTTLMVLMYCFYKISKYCSYSAYVFISSLSLH